MAARSGLHRSGVGDVRGTHGLYSLKQKVTKLTTKRLDGRSAIAVAVRTWKADVRRDLGGGLSRAQETVLEGRRRAG